MTTLVERLRDELFYSSLDGKQKFRYCDPAVTLEDDPYIMQLIPAIMRVIGIPAPVADRQETPTHE